MHLIKSVAFITAQLHVMTRGAVVARTYFKYPERICITEKWLTSSFMPLIVGGAKHHSNINGDEYD